MSTIRDEMAEALCKTAPAWIDENIAPRLAQAILDMPKLQELLQRAQDAVRYLNAMAKDDISNVADSIVAGELDAALAPFKAGA
jgi:hypothetical protein